MSRPSRSMDGTSAHFSARPPSISQISRPRGRSHSFSPRSPSQDSAGSQDIDEMLLEATTDDRRHLIRSPRQSALHTHHRQQQHDYQISYRAESPSSEYAVHPHSQLYSHARARGTTSLPHLDSHSPGAGPPGASVMTGAALQSDSSGPLPQPGQVQTYQTHIFAPPVTGAPVKKSKFTSGSTPSAAGVAGAANNASASGTAQAQG